MRARRNTLESGRKVLTLLFGAAVYLCLTMVIHGLLRGHADSAGSGSTYTAGHLEQAIFHGLPSVWMQHLLSANGPVAGSAFLIWSSFFYVPMVLCAFVLGVRGPREFLGLLALHALVIFSADIVYSLFPTRPPWMDAPVTRMIADATSNATRVDSNPFASVPSLHVALPVAYALWFRFHADRGLRPLGTVLGIWSLAMAWAVIYTGEHYLLGALAGVVWAAMFYAALRVAGVTYRAVQPQATAPAERRVQHLMTGPISA